MDVQQTRARSFGQVAGDYEAFRPGPPLDAVDWILSTPVVSAVDLGAGTGALSRLLVERVPDVIAVEPDAAMRAVLQAGIPGLDVREGTGEQIPVADGSIDAIIASSSWHWVEPEAGLAEAARALVPGGILAALWTGPDPDGVFMQQAQAVLRSTGTADSELRATVSGDRNPARTVLEVADDGVFTPPANEQFRFVLDLTADQLIGLLSTLSWIILLEPERRARLFDTARRLLRDGLGVEGEVTAAVDFVCDAYRSQRIP